jgi:hypothetical protein
MEKLLKFDGLLKKELGDVLEALTYVDNQQDAQEILNFVNKMVDKRKNSRRTIELINKMKDCAKELSKISPDLIFCVYDCCENQTVSINFQELYDALNERFN